MPPSSDPRMIKIQLGIALRQLREDAKFTAAEAAAAIGGRGPKLSKIESGKQAAKPDEVEKLSELYGVPTKRREYLVDLARQMPKRGPRRSMYRDAVPDWFERFLALESEATSMRLYEVEMVTGLLQTEDYARAVLLSWEPAADPRLIDRQVATRMRRQEVLTRKQRPLQLHVVLSEAALHRVLGSGEVMRAQLAHLIEVSHLPNVRLQILPFANPNRITVSSTVTLMHLREQQLSTVYMEDLFGATYLWDPEQFTRYSIVFDRLQSAALTTDDSRALIDRMKGTHM